MENLDQFKRMIAFDLDGTFFKETEWPEFGPSIEENIAFMRMLHDAGVPLAVFTARIYQDKDMEEKTIKELKARNVPYDELSCEKKPYYVLYVDDRGERVEHNLAWSKDNKLNILAVVEKYKMNNKPIETKVAASDEEKEEIKKQDEYMKNLPSQKNYELAQFYIDKNIVGVYHPKSKKYATISKDKLASPGNIFFIIQHKGDLIFFMNNEPIQLKDFASQYIIKNTEFMAVIIDSKGLLAIPIDKKNNKPQRIFYQQPIIIDSVEYVYNIVDVIYGRSSKTEDYKHSLTIGNKLYILSSLEEELNEKLDKDMSEEDIARVLDKIKKKKLNINVLKLAWPEISRKSDLLKKLREGDKNVV